MIKYKLYSIAIFLLAMLLLTSFISADASTSSFSIQSSTDFGNYQSLFSSSAYLGIKQSDQVFDMEVFIPPAGCLPNVVRSDLLEEQNVPVFCQLTALRINPGVDITHIDRIAFSRGQNQSSYISGIGFYPANAAIGSQSNLVSTPLNGVLGYVVVVLKQQPNEKVMPDVVTENLSAVLDYGTQYSLGVGQSDFYIPVLTDSEFADDYRSYGFFGGMGYLRVASVTSNSALVQIYTSPDHQVSSQSIGLGKTADNVLVSTITGGQYLKMTLEDITLPKTKARINMNGEEYDVYQGESFYNNKCTATRIVSYGGGTGEVTIRCAASGSQATLYKNFNDVQLTVDSNTVQSYSVGSLLKTDSDSNYYLLYSGIINGKGFVIVGKLSKTINADKNMLDGIRNSFSDKIGTAAKGNDEKAINTYISSKNNLVYKGTPYSLSYIVQNNPVQSGIALQNSLSGNGLINGDSQTYFNKATSAYDDVVSKFESQQYTSSTGGTSRTYGEQALWDEYSLAKELNQNSKVLEVLSKLETDYPNSLSNGATGQTATELFASQSPYSTVGSGYYFDKEGIQAELVSIDEPSKQDASVELTYSNSAGTNTVTVGENESIFAGKVGSTDVALSLASFNENSAGISYRCQKGNVVESTTISIGEQKNTRIAACDTTITIGKINLKKVAKINLIPKTEGISNAANFTFSINIEKRGFDMNLTPDEANSKINSLNKEIANFENITDVLNQTIRAGKLACLATSAYLNLKNVLFSSTGEATARTMAMTNSWNNICSKSADFDKCINNDSAAIDKSIEAVRSALVTSNNQEKGFQDAAKNAQGVVDYSKSLNQSVIAFKQSFSQTFGSLNIYDNNGVAVPITGGKIPSDGKLITDIINGMDPSKGHIGQTDFTNLKVNLYTLQNIPAGDSSLNDFKISTGKNIYNTLAKVKSAEDTLGVASDLSSRAGVTVEVYGNKQTQTPTYVSTTWSQIMNNYDLSSGITIGAQDYVNVYNYNNQNYLAVLSKANGNNFAVQKLYTLTDQGSGRKLLVDKDVTSDSAYKDAKNFIFNGVSGSSLKNRCLNCNFMNVFETDPYKNQPAMLPFDKDNGWYVAMQNNVPTGGTLATYQASGTPSTYWICNVGPNGLMEGINQGDDSQYCTSFSTLTGQSSAGIAGLPADQSKALIQKATRAIQDAQSQLAAGKNPITINGMTLKVQGVSNTNSGSKCTDFMSESDCKLMFNVCDPFICPTSRCDLGGQYPVSDVIQSGVVGSIALCAPNFIGFGGDVYVPICVTGLNAGLQGWISILKAYRSCINESVTNNRTVGICDQVNSVYVCDFFWRNIGPYISILAKNIFSGAIFGNRGVRGGGEYLFATDAWNNAEKSWNYFINSYASTSNLAAGFSSITQIGTEVCKMQMSATYPNALNTALEPESPIQFYSYFEELPFNSAVIPPASQYNIFYHIYAGDQGHYYTIYLKSPVQATSYSIAETVTIDSGYVPQGQEVSQTKNVLETSGYKELCVRIDTVDHCGFKSVGTDFGLNYAKDQVISAQASEGQIKTQSDCVSGTSSVASAVGGALGGNLQQAAQGAATPQIYNYGIIRICSGQNPGASTDPSRWREVGYCDNANIKCWIDSQSVKDAIRGAGIQNETLSQINGASISQQISEGYLNSSDANAQMDNAFKTIYATINALTVGQSLSSDLLTSIANLDSTVNALYQKLIFDTDKAKLLYNKAQIYDQIARKSINAAVNTAAAAPATVQPTTTAATSDSTLLAKMIWSEERSQGNDAMTAAAWVAINRINQPKNDGSGTNFPKTLSDVLQASGAFSLDNSFDTPVSMAPDDLTAYSSSKTIASGALAQNAANAPNQDYAGYIYFVNLAIPTPSDVTTIKNFFKGCGLTDGDGFKQVGITSMFVSKSYCQAAHTFAKSTFNV